MERSSRRSDTLAYSWELSHSGMVGATCAHEVSEGDQESGVLRMKRWGPWTDKGEQKFDLAHTRSQG